MPFSVERYQGEADMAQTARDNATNDSDAERFSYAWSAFITAANHAKLALRWQQTMADEQQVAAAPPRTDPWTLQYLGVREPPVDLTSEWLARAAEAHRIWQTHLKAADDWGERGFAFFHNREQPPPAETPRYPTQPPVVEISPPVVVTPMPPRPR